MVTYTGEEVASTQNSRGSFPRWSPWPQVLNAAWREASRKLTTKWPGNLLQPSLFQTWERILTHPKAHPRFHHCWGHGHGESRFRFPGQCSGTISDTQFNCWQRLEARLQGAMDQAASSSYGAKQNPNSGHSLSTLIWKVWARSGEGHSLTLS